MPEPVDRHDHTASYRPVSTTKWDMSWCDRVTGGKVRAVFDSPGVSEGAAMFRAQLWRDEHKEIYDTAPAETSAVIVFRHEGIPLVMNERLLGALRDRQGAQDPRREGEEVEQAEPDRLAAA